VIEDSLVGFAANLLRVVRVCLEVAHVTQWNPPSCSARARGFHTFSEVEHAAHIVKVARIESTL
jgi:hypothetical protein